MPNRDDSPARIVWHRNSETRYPYGAVSPDPDRLESLGFPPPWPSRPWIFGNVIASANGILTWAREGGHDDPVAAIAGGDFSRPGRLADRRLMRYLRACADAVSFGAQTLREQPDLVGTPEDVGGGLAEALRRFRVANGRRRLPVQVVYSASGRLDLELPMFNTPDLSVVVVTTGAGAARLRARAADAKGVGILVAGDEAIDSAGLARVHERLFAELAIRYLNCEGGWVILDSLHRAGLLDELFVTVTDRVIEPDAHAGVKRVFEFEAEGARLIAEGRTASDPGYVFRRWRFNPR